MSTTEAVVYLLALIVFAVFLLTATVLVGLRQLDVTLRRAFDRDVTEDVYPVSNVVTTLRRADK